MKNFKDYICPNCFQILDRCQKKSRCYFKILENDIPSFTNHKTSKLTDTAVDFIINQYFKESNKK